MDPRSTLAITGDKGFRKAVVIYIRFSHPCLTDHLGNQYLLPKKKKGEGFLIKEKFPFIKTQVRSSSKKVKGIYFMFSNLAYLSVWKHGSMQRLCVLLVFSWRCCI
jgi:hypothetical protein